MCERRFNRSTCRRSRSRTIWWQLHRTTSTFDFAIWCQDRRLTLLHVGRRLTRALQRDARTSLHPFIALTRSLLNRCALVSTIR